MCPVVLVSHTLFYYKCCALFLKYVFLHVFYLFWLVNFPIQICWSLSTPPITKTWKKLICIILRKIREPLLVLEHLSLLRVECSFPKENQTILWCHTIQLTKLWLQLSFCDITAIFGALFRQTNLKILREKGLYGT